MTTLENGRIIHTPPPLFIPPTQEIQGSALEAASSKTITSQQQLAEAAKTLGAGQKGAARKGGSLNLNASIPYIPEAGTIRGVSHEQNHLNAVNNLNQIRADKVGDADINAAPIKIGGRMKTLRRSKRDLSKSTHKRGSSKKYMIEEIFPRKKNVDYSKLLLTEEGLFSITRKLDSERIIRLIKKNIANPHELLITDATACNGGDTINFAMNFKHVKSIEMNDANFYALKNNVHVYDLKNVDLYHGDCTVVFNWYTDILYMDPPWGGVDYRKNKKLDLYLSGRRIDTWINEVLQRKNAPRMIVVKVPYNYNFERLDEIYPAKSIHVYKIRNYNMIIIKS